MPAALAILVYVLRAGSNAVTQLTYKCQLEHRRVTLGSSRLAVHVRMYLLVDPCVPQLIQQLHV
jgi:hypothetical protein